MEDSLHLLLDISLAAQQPKLLKEVWLRRQQCRHCPSIPCLHGSPSPLPLAGSVGQNLLLRASRASAAFNLPCR